MSNIKDLRARKFIELTLTEIELNMIINSLYFAGQADSGYNIDYRKSLADELTLLLKQEHNKEK